MQTKKSPEANLENKRLTYVLMGLVLSFAVFYVAFEWTEKDVEKYEVAVSQDVMFEEEMIERTEQEEEKEVEPQKPEVTEVIEEIQIVDDDVETADIAINSEDDQTQAQEVIQAPVEIEEEDPEENVVFVVVEKMPSFPGGQQALMKYLNENIRYPVIAQENGVQGRVIVQFTVRKDGNIDDVKVVRSADPSLDKEAIRLVKSMPAWEPGQQRGKAVHCKYTVPIVFKLQM
jgi:periplasmic protein TonB